MAINSEDVLRDRRNEVFTEFAKAWENVVYVLDMDGPFPVVYKMKDSDSVPDENKKRNPWARVEFKVTNSAPTSISKRKYQTRGFLNIELFVSAGTTDCGRKVELLGQYFADWFRRYRGRVNLRDVTPITREIVAGYASVALVSAFDYEEFHARDNNATNVFTNDILFSDSLKRITDDNGEAYRV